MPKGYHDHASPHEGPQYAPEDTIATKHANNMPSFFAFGSVACRSLPTTCAAGLSHQNDERAGYLN